MQFQFRNENEIISGLIFDPIKMKCFMLKKIMVHFLNQRIRVSKKKIEKCLFASNDWKIIKKNNFSYRKSPVCAALDMAYVVQEDMMDIFKKFKFGILLLE